MSYASPIVRSLRSRKLEKPVAEVRSLIESKFSREVAYKKALKRAQKLGYMITQTVPSQTLRVEKVVRHAGWWVAVIFGILLYVVPGILVLVLWKPIQYCELTFDDDDDDQANSSIIGKISGEFGHGFFNQIAAELT
jgi:hypothetical protein